MIRWGLLTVILTAVYLLVLASAKPGDILLGAALAGTIAAVVIRTGHAGHEVGERGLLARVAATPAFAAHAALELVKGTWHTATFALGRRPVEHPGFVEIPLGERTELGVVTWGLLTGISPDEIVVDIDEERGVALIHVLDDRDPDGVRQRHREVYERSTRRVFP